MKSKKRKKDKLKRLKLFVLGGLLVKMANIFCRKKTIRKVEDNFAKFVEEEKDEVEDLVKGKRSCKDFFCRSGRLFKDFFIPYDGNEHKPKLLRTKSLSIIVVALILIKAVTVGALFLVYPDKARMSEIISQRILELTNQERENFGLPVLILDPVLSASAQAKAEDMFLNNYFAHQSVNGFWPWDWINREQYPYLFVAENLAMNFTSAQSVHTALVRSASHQKNIISDKYTDIGLAVVSGEMDLPGQTGGKKTNVLVQLFASRKKEEKVAVAPETPPLLAEERIIKLEDKVIIEEPEPTAEAEVLTEESLLASTLESENVREEEKLVAVLDMGIEVVEEERVSPNLDLEDNQLTLAKISQVPDNTKAGWLSKLIISSQYLFIIILVILAIALLVNIFVRIRIQHKGVILQTLVVIVIIAGLLAVRVHILEEIGRGVLIL